MNTRSKLKHVEARQAKLTLRILFTLFLALAVSPLAACTPPIPGASTEIIPTSTSELSTTTTAAIPVTSQTETPTQTVISTATQTAGSTLTFSAEADARVEQAAPNKNFGNGATLRADGGSDPVVESFLTFAVTGITDRIQRAILRLYVPENGSGNGPAIYSTDTSWTEDKITWNTRPAPISDAVDNKEEIQPGTWVEYDITSMVTGNGTFSFLLAADSSDSAVFSSRQGEQPPQLVITLGSDSAATQTPSSTPTPTALTDGSAIFVGTGDISDCDNNNDELTARLLDAIPGTVFTTGDNVYSKGTSAQFADCYGPTWGRHKDRTKPIPGNHEYRTAGAAGYFQYFDNIPSYYVYDLGSWRIYALNSEIDVSLTSEQVKWLLADLAANPRQCVLAYWHQPRWSSGSHHGSNPDYQTLWQIFYEAGAELVLNGHEHNYERFAPMNGEGQADPLGMREFVLGTGGRNHYGFDKALPTSEVRDDTSYGVLKLTLRPSGYDWEFIPADGSTFTDSGSGECH